MPPAKRSIKAMRHLRSSLPGIVALAGINLILWGYLHIKPLMPFWIRGIVLLGLPASLYALYRGWVIRAPDSRICPGYRPDILADPARRYLHANGSGYLCVLGKEGGRRMAVLIAGLSLMFAETAVSNALKHGGFAWIVLIFPLTGFLLAWLFWPDDAPTQSAEGGIEMTTVQTPRRFSLPAWVFILAGLLFIAIGAYPIWLDLETKSWPRTRAVIEKSQIAQALSTGGVRTSTSTVVYQPRIVFRYQVGGRTYTGNHVYRHEAGSISIRSLVEKIVTEYPAGKHVQVAYNPDDPSEAVLEPGKFGYIWIPALFGAIFMVIGIAIFRLRPRETPSATRLARTAKATTRPSGGRTDPRHANIVTPTAIRKIATLGNLIFLAIFVGVFAKLWFKNQDKQTTQPATAHAGNSNPISENRAPLQPGPTVKTTKPATPQDKPVSLPTGKQVVVQTIQPRSAIKRQPRKVPEPVRRFLARIGQEPSPCPDLLAGIDREITQGGRLDDLFARLQRCKWERPTYTEERVENLLFRYNWLDPWPEEQAIRKVIAAMARRTRPPQKIQVYSVPDGDAPVINGILSDEWNDALVFAPRGSKARVYLKTDGDFLYLGVAVPQGPVKSNYDSARVLLNAHLSPDFANEYFFIYSDGHPSKGIRSNRIKPRDAPKVKDWRERDKLPKAIRWKALDTIYDGGVFPHPPTATFVQGGVRMYEAAIDLKATGLPKGSPFPLGLQIDTTTVDGKNRQPVWPFKWNYAGNRPDWEVWLRIP